MKNPLTNIGTGLVLIGFLIFLIIPVLTRHQLTDSIIEADASNPEKSQLLKDEFKAMMGCKVNGIVLQQKIGAAVVHVNQLIISSFGINDQSLQELAYIASKQSLDEAVIAGELTGKNGELQQKQFESYGSWLYGRTYDSKQTALLDLESVRNSINTYELIPKYGFDKYAAKNLRYTLAKHSVIGPVKRSSWSYMFLTFGLCIVGALLMTADKLKEPEGIKNNNVFRHPATSRKWLGVIIGTLLIIFYIILYFYPHYMTAWITLVDPVSYFLQGSEAGQFFLYGLLYTVSVLVMGVRMLVKYWHNQYQIVRTLSVMFFQTVFAFLLPEILVRLNKPYFDFKNIWPLQYDFFFDFNLNMLIQNGSLGIFMLVWGIALSFIAVPLLTYYFGKRWYCSWVCGCGGLAETLGDPFRQLSDKSLKAWRIERISIYSVLAFAIIMTVGVLYTYFTGTSTLLGINSYSLREAYGGLIGAGFAGVVGTGFYPFLGNRSWCRFGCPLAAYLGIVQRLKSRFRITTNGGQCISCGNCSTYCEMGIDVRSYAQKGENIVRASCVGCGICAAVCPRGVLRLENTSNSRLTPNGFVQQ